MKSKQENSYGLFDKAKTSARFTYDKARNGVHSAVTKAKKGVPLVAAKARNGFCLAAAKTKRGATLAAAKAKEGLGQAIVKVRSSKIPLSRLSTYLLHQNAGKSKVLKIQLAKLKVSINSISFCSVNKIFGELFRRIKSFRPGKSGEYPNKRAVIAAAAAVVLLAVSIGANLRVEAFAVEADGKRIAIIDQKDAAEKLLADIKVEKGRLWNRKVDVKQQLVFEAIKARRFQVDNLTELKNILNKNITFVAVATGISVNGQVAVVVKDNKVAEDLLEKLKSSTVPDNVKVENIAFEEKVEFVDVPVSLKDVSTIDDAIKVLKEGKQKKVVHVVKEGDSLWSIARANDMHVPELLEANPSIKGEHLDLDQEINLVALEPVVNVIITGRRTVEEAVPYKTIVKKDTSLWRGRETVKTRGENGAREVTYQLVLKNGVVVEKDVLKEKVLKVATNKVVVRGSRYVVASRGTGGMVGWPISGRINSGYGGRWGRMHTGIDIDAYKGQPVGAAAEGVITGAGWDGGYGKMVTIKHSNGLVTRYAHLSKIEVSVGQSVERGDLIGLAGSTGRSTGPHLHFEVLSGGSFQNPMKFLK